SATIQHTPRGNSRSIIFVHSETKQKQQKVARKLRPDEKTTAILMNPNNPNAEIQLSEIQTAARIIGQEIKIVNARTIREIDAGFTTLVQMRAGALIVAQDPFFFTRAAQLVVLAARHALPAVYYRREFVIAGGLLSYGANANDSYRLLGVYAARILKGEKPGDLPIQLPTKFELVINLSTANALGLEVPATLIARADEVIE